MLILKKEKITIKQLITRSKPFKQTQIELNKMYQEKLQKAGFKVKRSSIELKIPISLLDRYKNLPTEYLTFLKNFEEIINEKDTAWFNLVREFNGNLESEFKWNEFELMSMEWSEDDNDELKVVTEFWNHHIPIVMSVKNEYQFLAICLEKEKYGEIVHGIEPEFENVKKVCGNLTELVNLFEKKQLQNLV